MKTSTILPMILLLSLTLLIVFSCKKDPTENPVTPPLGLEQMDLPGAMMTLSAISYVADGQPESVIRDSITILLSDTSLATQGKWQLAWGPGISGMKSNLSFVVSIITSSGPVYAIVIRGTNTFS
ncbi:MAG: hypothetical protein JXA23_03915, partial [Bacteroidales bacterium]|nr:hypothetical protein [Bacteroidales bacterium]